MAGYLKQNKPRSKILIFDANNHFPTPGGFYDAWHSLYPGMIEWIPVVEDGAVERVAPAQKVLYTSRGAHRVDVANIIPPQAPGLLAVQAGLASDHGWCPIKPETFESLGVAERACDRRRVHRRSDAEGRICRDFQAKQCALAIVATLEGRKPPAPVFESVCYSMLARGSALSIHGRFPLVRRGDPDGAGAGRCRFRKLRGGSAERGGLVQERRERRVRPVS